MFLQTHSLLKIMFSLMCITSSATLYAQAKLPLLKTTKKQLIIQDGEHVTLNWELDRRASRISTKKAARRTPSLFGNQILNHFNAIVDNLNGYIYFKPNRRSNEPYANYQSYVEEMKKPNNKPISFAHTR